jgi:hypothetical protein
MNLKYEKITETEELGVTSNKIEDVEEKDATHVHKCRHDEGLPCSREAKK